MSSSYDQSIGAFTGQTHRNMMRFLSLHLEKYDITIEQWGILFRLAEENGVNQKKLAEKSNKDQPTVARILDLMERKQLIARKVSPEDRRAFLIFITDKGVSLKEEVSPFMEELFGKILFGISEEKLDIYRQVLTDINNNISNLLNRVE